MNSQDFQKNYFRRNICNNKFLPRNIKIEKSKIILKDSYHVCQLKEETPAYNQDNIYSVFYKKIYFDIFVEIIIKKIFANKFKSLL